MRLLISLFGIIVSLVFTTSVWASDVVKIKSDNFTLSGEIDPDDGVDMISELERFRSSLLEMHSIPASVSDRNVDIYIISDPDIFKILGLDENFVAVYTPTSVGPRALVNGNALKTDPESLRQSLRHEYAHHFNFVHLRVVLPRWLNEGLAEYFAGYVELPDGRYQIGTTLDTKKVILTYPLEGWYPLNKQVTSFAEIEYAPYRKVDAKSSAGWIRRPEDSDFFYAQSWALVHYMKNQPGGMDTLERLAEHVISVKSGSRSLELVKSIDESNPDLQTIDEEIDLLVEAILEQKPDEVFATLQNYVAGDLPVITRNPLEGRSTASVTTENLSSTQAAGLQYRLMSLIASQATINAKMKDVRAIVESDPTLKTSLLISDAAQQSKLGFPVDALKLINQALALDPSAPDAEMLKAHIEYEEFANGNYYKDIAMRNRLRPLLAAAPNDAGLLVKMVTTGINDPQTNSPDVANALAEITRLQLIKHDPVTASPLVNYYIAKQDYQQALDLARRVMPFIQRNFQVKGLVDQLEKAVAESSTP